MQEIITLLINYPAVMITILIVLCLGGLVNIVIILDRRFGLLGSKGPTIKDVLSQLELIQKETYLTNNNHLSHLPDAELAIQRIEANTKQTIDKLEKLDKISDTLIRIEERLKK